MISPPPAAPQPTPMPVLFDPALTDPEPDADELHFYMLWEEDFPEDFAAD